jgi:hypothetical protein
MAKTRHHIWGNCNFATGIKWWECHRKHHLKMERSVILLTYHHWNDVTETVEQKNVSPSTSISHHWSALENVLRVCNLKAGNH